MAMSIAAGIGLVGAGRVRLRVAIAVVMNMRRIVALGSDFFASIIY
jgi:hypothetical protein